MGTELIHCSECNCEILKSIYEIKRKRKLGKDTFFCSLSCGTKFQIRKQTVKRKSEYELNPKKCIYCRNPIGYEYHKIKKFCSHTCSATFNNLKRGRTEKICLSCKTTYFPKNLHTSKFCSKNCESKNKKYIRINKLISGKFSNETFNTQTVKKALLEVRGEICEGCKLKLWRDKPIKLTLHHKDGDAYNNNIDNLQILCWNCHSLTENYGRKNKQSTRMYRYSKINLPN
jgi:hypothetical protein